MPLSLKARSAFTLVEMVVVLAIMGIALSLAGPSLMRPRGSNDLQSVLDRTRSVALRKAEPVTLIVGATGDWQAFAAKSSALSFASGKLDHVAEKSMRIDISALGLCTSDELVVSATATPIALNPFACVVSEAGKAR